LLKQLDTYIHERKRHYENEDNKGYDGQAHTGGRATYGRDVCEWTDTGSNRERYRAVRGFRSQHYAG
jgi:hypothetical protein